MSYLDVSIEVVKMSFENKAWQVICRLVFFSCQNPECDVPGKSRNSIWFFVDILTFAFSPVKTQNDVDKNYASKS